jgi:MFS family permease
VSARRASLLAWSLAGLCATVYVCSVPLYLLARSAHVPSSWGADLSVGGLLAGGFFLVFPLLGALIAATHPRNPIGWILLAEGLFWTLSDTLNYYVLYGVAGPDSVPFPVGVAGISNVLWVPTVGLMGTYVFLLFPDGRPPSGRWRPLAWLAGVVIVLFSIGVGLAPGQLEHLGGMRNPFGLEGYPWFGYALYAVLPLFLVCMLLSVFSLILRYRRSRGEERLQIKWIALASTLIGLLYLTAMIGSFVYPQETWFAPGSPPWLNLLEYAALLSFLLVPIAVGVAMLCYRLYDIDIIINRTLVYGALTVSLVLIYFGGVASIQVVFRTFTGQEQQPQLAVVVSTLAIAALFNPLRRRIQSLIDRRFYRSKYDAQKTLSALSNKLREETDLDRLGDELLLAVRDTMQPEHASLWLRPAGDPIRRHSQAAGETAR